jgi:hypothetical protein
VRIPASRPLGNVDNGYYGVHSLCDCGWGIVSDLGEDFAHSTSQKSHPYGGRRASCENDGNFATSVGGGTNAVDDHALECCLQYSLGCDSVQFSGTVCEGTSHYSVATHGTSRSVQLRAGQYFCMMKLGKVSANIPTPL